MNTNKLKVVANYEDLVIRYGYTISNKEIKHSLKLLGNKVIDTNDEKICYYDVGCIGNDTLIIFNDNKCKVYLLVNDKLKFYAELINDANDNSFSWIINKLNKLKLFKIAEDGKQFFIGGIESIYFYVDKYANATFISNFTVYDLQYRKIKSICDYLIIDDKVYVYYKDFIDDGGDSIAFVCNREYWGITKLRFENARNLLDDKYGLKAIKEEKDISIQKAQIIQSNSIVCSDVASITYSNGNIKYINLETCDELEEEPRADWGVATVLFE